MMRVADSDDNIKTRMASDRSKLPSKLIPILKWGGCSTAAVFAFVGLLLEIVQPVSDYETLSRYIWVISTISIMAGFTGAVLDRSDEQQNV